MRGSAAWNRLELLLSGVRYKPRWTFTPSPDRLAVEVFATVQDVYHPERPTMFGMYQDVPSVLVAEDSKPEDFYAWLFKVVIQEVEDHEAREWFTIWGARIYDPHLEPA